MSFHPVVNSEVLIPAKAGMTADNISATEAFL